MMNQLQMPIVTSSPLVATPCMVSSANLNSRRQRSMSLLLGVAESLVIQCFLLARYITCVNDEKTAWMIKVGVRQPVTG